jgi:hypothetical protein
MWLQNIDSRDFVCKFFGINGLEARQKAKAARCAASFLISLSSIVLSRGKLTCNDLAGRSAFGLLRLWGFPPMWGLDSF